MPRAPLATYRLQLHSKFGFADAAKIADYLAALGVSHAYSSPYLQAAPNSQHGYDVVDHHKVNEELGGGKAYDAFCKSLGEAGLGQVLDIVPNHMAISGRRNRYWWDVLENGPASRYASYFDVDWHPREEKLQNKMLMPVLGDHYGRVLERYEIKVQRHGGEFAVHYFDNELPAAPKSISGVIVKAAQDTGSDYLTFLADSLKRLPGPTAATPDERLERHRDKEVIRGLIERLCAEVPFIAEAIDQVLATVNRSPDALHDILERQNYRLAFWRTAEQDLGYRRFFDVNTLIGLRMEDPKVFADTHALILTWLREGVLDGVRIDHPDGLRDPKQYLQRLRDAASGVWIGAEKILEPGESLRTEWPIDGTTGYDFLNESGGLFVDASQEAEFSRIYTEFTGEPTDYAAVCRDKKLLVMREILGSDVNRLTTLFGVVCEVHRDRRDFTQHDIRHAIRELAACFPVYRTYVVPERDELTGEDLRYISEACEAGQKNRPDLDPDLFKFLSDVLSLEERGTLESEFVLRFQQFTSPVMAKGVEDTVFYGFNRLLALNEVGGDPGRFGVSPEAFHEFCAENAQRHPHTMLASSTHDTKRSEDVRARLSVLSEMPARWERIIRRWTKRNDPHKTNNLPDRNTEYFLYQTMIGAWPIEPDRLLPYMEKACREAKLQTSWVAPNEPFETATQNFINSIYEDAQFLEEVNRFVDDLLEPGRINSLSTTLLKLTAPGIPDLYQGSELWDLSLVDPDNRRPVDYERRRELLNEMKGLNVEQVKQRGDEGLPKLWVVHHALRARREHSDVFLNGAYQALAGEGSRANHLVAFLRSDKVAVLVPRLVFKLNHTWINTAISLPLGKWRNELTGEVFNGGKLRMRDALASFPLALLIRE